jgi:hypothetical protein
MEVEDAEKRNDEILASKVRSEYYEAQKRQVSPSFSKSFRRFRPLYGEGLKHQSHSSDFKRLTRKVKSMCPSPCLAGIRLNGGVALSNRLGKNSVDAEALRAHFLSLYLRPDWALGG